MVFYGSAIVEESSWSLVFHYVSQDIGFVCFLMIRLDSSKAFLGQVLLSSHALHPGAGQFQAFLAVSRKSGNSLEIILQNIFF